uniref:LRRCT domain-containing protein n=1 Tax=Lates calcarifer TaxID=8187 RepID=A0A4W6FH25_LATCA
MCLFFNCTGSLCFILILFTLPHLTCTMKCPNGCQCNPDGGVLCVGYTITDIPKQLPVNTYLLVLTKSHLHTIHPQAFHVAPQLKSVQLSNNDLSTLPARVFSPLTTLEELHLNGNQLETIASEMFDGLVGLLVLDLSRNKLTSPPSNVFNGLINLNFLNLGRNSIKKELPSDLFCCLPNLKNLSLKFNNLHHLHPQLFSRLTALGMLFLNDNKLQNLPEYIFQGLGQLFTINLKNNHLQTLPGDVFLSNTALRALDLSGNPWDCTCSIRGIARWIRHNEHVVTDKEDVICHSPMYQMLRTIGSLRDEEFNFCDATRVPSYFPTQNDLHEPTQPFHTISTDRQRSGSATMPPTTTSTTPVSPLLCVLWSNPVIT